MSEAMNQATDRIRKTTVVTDANSRHGGVRGLGIT